MSLVPRPSVGSQKVTRTVGKSYQSLIIMLLITLVMLGGIGARLAYLQLSQGERHRQMA
jgi:penicillin-binding protein 2